jgi:sugar-specific transcriptional regulator TrmB
MLNSLLQELGLTQNEAKVYEALVTYGGSGVSTISLRSKVHRRNAYECLHRLIEKGLVYEVFSRGETTYEAVQPGKLMELIQEKEIKLAAALPDLMSVFRQHRSPQRAYIYKGVEGVKNYMNSALEIGQDMYILGSEGAWFDPRLEAHTHRFLKEAEVKGMKLHILFDHDVREHAPELPPLLTDSYKFLPQAYSTDATMDIFGDHVVTYTGMKPGKLIEDAIIFVMVSQPLAEGYRIWWKLLWNLLPK